MKKNGRPKGTYGKNTLEIVVIIKARGPSTFREVLPLTGDISPTVARDACRNAVKHGLLAFDRSQRPGIYMAVSGSV